MKARLRCEECGRLVDPSQLDGTPMQCSRCGNEVRSADLSADGSATPISDELHPSDVGVTARIAAAFPWVASVLLHVALGLIMLLVTIVLTQSPDTDRPINPPSLTPAEEASMNGAILPTPPDPSDLDDDSPRPDAPSNLRDDRPVDTPKLPDQPEPMIGIGGSSGESGEFSPGNKSTSGFFGIATGGQGRGDPNWAPGGKADVVYVLDRSGSMAMGGLFDTMCRELVGSLSGFEPGYQRYHVVFFGDGTCHEAPGRGLTEPTDEELLQTAKWVDTLKATGQTDPTKALARAFDILSRRRDKTRGAVIFLLTDAAFPDNAEVTKLIRRRNRNKNVRIHTLLLGSRPTVAVDVMKQIASENGGRYKYIAGQ